ncbi:hypothetical protein AJ88_03215 [Mesorhizobium amorphae CCBAU 01583]|nr:hypothetical protein AJ88_03215 [Mesorhizobium amorphae CCBAU 01583]
MKPRSDTGRFPLSAASHCIMSKTSAERPWQQEASLNRTQTAAGLLLAVISATAAQAKSSIPTVTNDPLGANTAATLTPGISDLINNTPTSSIPAIHHQEA